MGKIKGVGAWIRLNGKAILIGFALSLLYHVTIVPLAWSRDYGQNPIFPPSLVSVFPGMMIAAPVALVGGANCENSYYNTCRNEAVDPPDFDTCLALAKESDACKEPIIHFSQQLGFFFNFLFFGAVLSSLMAIFMKTPSKS
jgi:hypothetical protein